MKDSLDLVESRAASRRGSCPLSYQLLGRDTVSISPLPSQEPGGGGSPRGSPWDTSLCSSSPVYSGLSSRRTRISAARTAVHPALRPQHQRPPPIQLLRRQQGHLPTVPSCLHPASLCRLVAGSQEPSPHIGQLWGSSSVTPGMGTAPGFGPSTPAPAEPGNAAGLP